MRVLVGRTLPLVLWAFFSIALTPARADAQTSSLIDLGTLGGSFSDAVAINATGQVVGVSENSSFEFHAFRWHNGGMTGLGTLGGAFSEATAINAAGQVVGQSRTERGGFAIFHAFLWDNGVMTDLGTLGGQDSVAFGINASGQVVGRAAAADGEPHGFLWHNGVMTDLGTLGGRFSVAVALNDVGQVVGLLQTTSFELHAFLWQNGLMTDLGTLGGTDSMAIGINKSGQVVGRAGTASGEEHAFLWQNGLMTDLGTLGGFLSFAAAINAAGQVAGAASTARGELHAFLVTPVDTDSDGKPDGWFQDADSDGINDLMTDLGTLGGSFSEAVAINDKGQVVGHSNTASRRLHGFLWQDGVMTDLGTLGGFSSDATAINDKGQIPGRSTTANGDQHAFLFSVPTDTTAPMTSAAPSPSPNANGWNKTDVTVNLSSVDDEGGSGVKEIVFSATGARAIGSTTVPGSSVSITVADEGTTTLTYFARDNAGNEEAPHSLMIQIDKTLPVVTSNQTPLPNANGWNNTDVTVHFAATDSLSGIQGASTFDVLFNLEGANQSAGQTFTDLAGNSASVTVSGINIDKTLPVISGLPTPGCSLWPPDHSLVQVATVMASDGLSGLAPGSPLVTGVSNEPEQGLSEGDKAPDIVITGGSVQLRAERGEGGTGRVYTLTGAARDLADNLATATATCTVPHDQRKLK